MHSGELSSLLAFPAPGGNPRPSVTSFLEVIGFHKDGLDLSMAGLMRGRVQSYIRSSHGFEVV